MICIHKKYLNPLLNKYSYQKACLYLRYKHHNDYNFPVSYSKCLPFWKNIFQNDIFMLPYINTLSDIPEFVYNYWNCFPITYCANKYIYNNQIILYNLNFFIYLRNFILGIDNLFSKINFIIPNSNETIIKYNSKYNFVYMLIKQDLYDNIQQLVQENNKKNLIYLLNQENFYVSQSSERLIENKITELLATEHYTIKNNIINKIKSEQDLKIIYEIIIGEVNGNYIN